MTILKGKTAQVKLFENIIAEQGQYSFSGFTRDNVESTAFGDDVKKFTFTLGDGGTISFSGNYDPSDSNGQNLINSYCSNGSTFAVGDLRFYINNTSYITVATGGQILVTKVKAINFTQSGLGTISFEGKVSSNSLTISNFFTSEFTGTSGTLGESWIESDASDKLTKLADQLKTIGGAGMAWWDGTFSNTQYSQLVFKATNGGGSIYAGPAVRLSGSTGNAYGYGCFYRAQTGAEVLFIWKWNNQSLVDSGSQLGAQINVTLIANDILKIAVQGTTITIYINGIEQTTRIDSDISSGNPGITISNNIANTDWITWDNWEGGKVGLFRF